MTTSLAHNLHLRWSTGMICSACVLRGWRLCSADGTRGHTVWQPAGGLAADCQFARCPLQGGN